MLALDPHDPPDRLANRRFFELLAIESLIAALAGFLFLGADSLWFDEGITAQVIELDWRPFWRVLGETEGMQGAYYLLLKLWVGVAGDGEVMLRAPSAITAVLAVAGVALVGRELFSAQVGLTAGFLVAVNPFFIEFAQEARSYALALALVTYASYTFIRMIREPGRRWVYGYVILSSLATYAHPLALLIVVAHFLSLAVMPPSTRSRRVLASIAISIALALTPLGLFMLTTSDLHLSWIPRSDLIDLGRHASRLAGGRWLFLLYVPIAALPVVVMLRRRFADHCWHLDWPLVLTLSWLIVPTAALFLVSYAVPMFVSRYLLITLPALALLVAVGLSRFDRAPFVYATLVLVVALSSSGLWSGYHSTREDWRNATAYIGSEARSGDVLILNRLEGRYMYDYYRERRETAGGWPSVVEYPDTSAFEISRLYSIAELRVPPLTAASYERVWLVLSHDGAASSGAMINFLERDLEAVEERRFESGIRVLLFDGE